MIVTIAALVVALLGLGVLLDRVEKRMSEERRGWQLERANLLQRIQAPQMAVLEHDQAQVSVPGVTHALSDEQAAEAEERARVIAEMERIENEALEARQL